MEFQNLQEAIKYMARRSKAYHSEVEYYSSAEYKKIYPELCRLNRQLQAAYTVHH